MSQQPFMPILPPRDVSNSPDPATLRVTNRRATDAEYLEAADDGSLSGNTVRALRADLERFAAWCAERGLSPLPARTRPRWWPTSRRWGASARPPPCAATSQASPPCTRRTGERNPSEHATVGRALQRMRRRQGCRQAQVQGLTWALRQRLMEAAGDRMIDVPEPRDPGRGLRCHVAPLRAGRSASR